MEAYLAAAETHLVDSLNYEQPKVAQYILGRKQVSIPAAGGDIYGPTAARTARFNISTSGPMVDLSTLAIKGTVKNTQDGNTKKLVFLGANMGVCIQSARVFAGNVEIDRVDHYAATEGMLSLLQTPAKRVQEYTEGFGCAAGSRGMAPMAAAEINNLASKTVVWRPKALGCLQTPMYLPTSFVSGGGVTLELTFVGTCAEACEGVDATANRSQKWEWSGLSLICDVVQLDPSFLTSLGAHLVSGGSISLHYKAYQTTFYSILANHAQLIHARANTRLNSIMLQFQGAETATGKRVNRKRSPGETFRMRSQIGELTYPDFPVSGLNEFYYRLIMATGAGQSAAHTPSIQSTDMAGDAFIAIQDFEACPHQAAGTGQNTFNSQLSLQLEGITGGGVPGDTLIDSCLLTSYHDVVMEISASGVTVAV